MSKLVKKIFKEENFSHKNRSEEQSNGRTTNQDSLHFDKNSDIFCNKIEPSEISNTKTQNYFMALNSLCVSLDNINEKEIFEDINEYSETKTNQTKDENITKYIHRPLIKEFIKIGNNLKMIKSIKTFGTSINNIYSFNYDLSSIFEQLRCKKKVKFLRLDLSSKIMIKNKIFNKIKASKINNNILGKETRNSIKRKISIKQKHKNKKIILKKELKNLNKNKIQEILDKINYLKIKNNKAKAKINKEIKNNLYSKKKPEKHIELKTGTDNKKVKEGPILIKMKLKRTTKRNKIYNLSETNKTTNENIHTTNYLTNKNEITTIRDDFHNNYIKIDNYKRIIEYSPVEPKSYIVKNLLNEFNFSSYGMNSDDSRFLNLYKIPK